MNMGVLVAASLVNNAAEEKLRELNLLPEVQRGVVMRLAYWWALGMGDDRLMAEFKRLGIPDGSTEERASENK